MRGLIISIFIALWMLVPAVGQPSSWKSSKVLRLKPIEDTTAVHTGLDLLAQHDFRALGKKPVAVIGNCGSYTRRGQHIFDLFQQKYQGACRAFIQVEEEIIESTSAGQVWQISDSTVKTRFSVVNRASLTLNPEIVGKAGLIVFDLQNSGTAFGLDVAVLIMTLEYCRNNKTALVILDRPNPLNARDIEGPLTLLSGTDHKIPIRYGLTLAELALLINEEHYFTGGKSASLSIIPMVNYSRAADLRGNGFKFRFPVADIWDTKEAVLYAGLDFLRFTNLSYGEGTNRKFGYVGAPWINGPELAGVMNTKNLQGILFNPTTFQPASSVSIKTAPRYSAEDCAGVELVILSQEQVNPFEVGAGLVEKVAQLYPRHFRWEDGEAGDKWFGGRDLRTMIDIGADLRGLMATWIAEATPFQKISSGYYLYPLNKK